MTEIMTEIKKHKKFYKEGEVVWVKADKVEAEVLEIDTKALTAKIKITTSGVTETGGYVTTTEKTLPLWEITKLRKKVAVRMVKFRKLDEVLFAKVNPEAKIPSKREEDGCYDIYACFTQGEVVIEPGETVLVPTGIASSFSSKYRINVKRERGSTGMRGMSIMGGQIDSGYRGEWFIAMNNASNKTIKISKDVSVVTESVDVMTYPYSKAIAQAAVEFVPVVVIKEVSYEEIQTTTSERGVGALGSSSK